MSDETKDEPGVLEGLAADAKAKLAKAEEEARMRAAAAAAEAAVAGAAKAVAKAADGVLDGLESMLFGKVGGAKEHLDRENADPLDRLRAQYAKPEPKEAPKAAPKVDPVAKARAELEALKAARGAKAEPPRTDGGIKKTL